MYTCLHTRTTPKDRLDLLVVIACVVMACVVMACVVMACMAQDKLDLLVVSESVFAVLFSIELVMKLVALLPKAYFSEDLHMP